MKDTWPRGNTLTLLPNGSHVINNFNLMPMVENSIFPKMSDEELEEGLDVIKDYIDYCFTSRQFDKMQDAVNFQSHIVEEYESRIFSTD